MQTNDYDYLFRIILVGDSNVGKSCLLKRFTEDVFHENQANTIGVDFGIKTIEVDGKLVKLQIWDTAGQERFKTITQSYYRGCHGTIVAYDMTNKESFNNVSHWMSEVEKHKGAGRDPSRIVVGNKCDLVDQRQVHYDEAKDLADHFNVRMLEASAKRDQNIDDAFVMVTREIMSQIQISEEIC